MARPRKEIDKRDFEKLCGLQCTKEEIADWFEVSEDTIERWCKRTYKQNFAVVFRQKRNNGKISLRRYQFRLAEKNATMAIFLGKNYLGQKDQTEKEDESDEKIKELINPLKEAEDVHEKAERLISDMADEYVKKDQSP